MHLGGGGGGVASAASRATPYQTDSREVLRGAAMARHFDSRATESAAVLLKVGGRYSAEELDAALDAARRVIQGCFEEINAGGDAGRTLIEAVDAARSIARSTG